jgi:hypothetical protein
MNPIMQGLHKGLSAAATSICEFMQYFFPSTDWVVFIALVDKKDFASPVYYTSMDPALGSWPLDRVVQIAQFAAANAQVAQTKSPTETIH